MDSERMPVSVNVGRDGMIWPWLGAGGINCLGERSA